MHRSTAMVTRRTLLYATHLALATMLARPRVVSARPAVAVDDWAAAPVGARGVPPGWQKYETPGGRPRYDFTVVEREGRRALDMKGHADHSTIARELRVDLSATPQFRWSWNMVTLPDRADLRRRETSDAAGHVFVVWRRPPAFLRSRLIGYVWEAARPVDTVTRSRKSDMVTFVVVRSGRARLGEWLTYERNVAADYRKIFDEEPPNPSAIALSIDTKDTGSTAETLIGSLAFV